MTAMTVERAVALIAYGLHNAARSHYACEWLLCPSRQAFLDEAGRVIKPRDRAAK